MQPDNLFDILKKIKADDIINEDETLTCVINLVCYRNWLSRQFTKVCTALNAFPENYLEKLEEASSEYVSTVEGRAFTEDLIEEWVVAVDD